MSGTSPLQPNPAGIPVINRPGANATPEVARLHAADAMQWTGSSEAPGLMPRLGGLPAGHPSIEGGTPPPECPASRELSLSSEQLGDIAKKKATCPFIGSAVNGGALPVQNDPNNPLASIDRVKQLGDSGGGDLGSHVLVLFAQGNHAKMRGADGQLDQPAPAGLFSLDFPGSQGSHPGHSGILQGDPKQLDSGRFNPDDFERLASRADANGNIKLSDVGDFIAENLRKDPNSKVFQGRVAGLLGRDLFTLAKATPADLLSKLTGSPQQADAAHRDICEKLTKLTGEDNLIGSAGEFGLLFAFLQHKPGAVHVDGEPTVSLADVKSMFVDKKFPDGWDTWPKYGIDWVTDTTRLLVSAGKAYAENPGTH